MLAWQRGMEKRESALRARQKSLWDAERDLLTWYSHTPDKQRYFPLVAVSVMVLASSAVFELAIRSHLEKHHWIVRSKVGEEEGDGEGRRDGGRDGEKIMFFVVCH